MDYLLYLVIFVVGWICGTLSSRRGSNGASLGIIGTILVFIGLQ